MNPSHLECTECGEKFQFPDPDRAYYLGSGMEPKAVVDNEILAMLLVPAWCLDCNEPSWVEDIPSIKILESQFLAVKMGMQIEYPFDNQFMSIEDSLFMLRKFIEWRQKRVSVGSCVICNGSKNVVLGGEPVRLKHECCDYGVFKPTYTLFSCNGPMKTQIYSVEGRLIGRLSHWSEDLCGWEFVKSNVSI